jgi:hypothetical protein
MKKLIAGLFVAAVVVATASGIVAWKVFSASGPAPGTHRVAAADGSFTLDLPDSWRAIRVDPSITAEVVLGAEAPDPAVQLSVSSFATPYGAQERAALIATRLADELEVACVRREQSAGFAGHRALIECPEKVEGGVLTTLLFPVVHGAGSVLVFTQTRGTTADAAPLIGPILESWRWAR